MIDIKEIKYLSDIQTSRLNADDGEDFVGINEFVNLENLRSGTTDKGVTGTLESIGSNVLLSTPLPSQTFITIGGAVEVERNRFCFFRYCTTGPWHKISCRDNTPGINQEFDVLLSSQVTGGLNFSKDSIIHSAYIIDGTLYWVDGTNNQPRQIDIDAGIKLNNPSYSTSSVAYTSPIDFSEITLIKPPPPLAPNILKKQDVSFPNNFIANDSFMFAFRYRFYGGNYSVLGTYSPSSRLNKPGATENYIQVTMDGGETIPQRARYIELIVRYSNSNNAFIIKTWDKNVAADLAQINAQNNRTSVLSYNFYNTVIGESIPNGLDDNGNQIQGLVNLVMKPYDSVPIFSQTFAPAKNKIFLANNTQGYDSPTTTSLSFSQISTNTNFVNLRKPLIQVRLSFGNVPFGPFNGYSAWYVFLTEVVPQGYYEITSTVLTNSSITPPALAPAPGFVAFASLNFRGASQSDVVSYARTLLSNTGTQIFNVFNTLTDPIAGYTNITGLSISTYDFFKTRVQYQSGVVFYDFAMRKCGVVTNDGLIFTIPTRTYLYTSGVSQVVWSLSNANAINEIPSWAYYYSVVRTLNLTTRFFIQSFSNVLKYATKDVNGVYQFSSNTFITNCVGIGVPTSAIQQSGLGYVFTEGSQDVCVLIDYNNNVYELPVIGQDGNYVIIGAKDIGNLSGRQFVFELYTPYQKSTQEPFYEVGEMYKILNPGTSSRQYGTLSDIFLPDSYVVTRNYSGFDYFSEAMSPNDHFWKTWFDDTGKVNYVTTLGQVVKNTSISYSNNFIPNTSINGLNTFDVEDTTTLPLEGGEINKLVLTSKVQEELGSVMLAICRSQTISMYIGEVQQYGSTGRSQNIVTSDQVIGTVNVLRGNFGTVDPSSVVEFRGSVFYFDAINGRWIQYAGNGLFPISNYKMERFWSQWSKQYLSMTKSQIEDLGDRPFVFATIDPYHMELLISIPKLSSTPPKGYLPDYPSTVYPFDILDYQGKTIVYKLDRGIGSPKWMGSYSFVAEFFVTLFNNLYSFKNGLLYLHNQTTTYNQFYGVSNKSKAMIVFNQAAPLSKVYNNLGVKSNVVPTFVYGYVDNPYQQSTDLADISFTQLDGIWYATFLRNKLQPTATGFDTNGLLTGEKMRAASMFVMLQYDVNSTPVEIEYVSVGYIQSIGQTFLNK